VVTFDDITELLAAQRKAAWSDVARRIAHEIKNPLTPIQLSAERIKKKYLSQITNDPDTFRVCADTIVRHVGDIGRMVDEFSAFARMPAPEIARQDLKSLVEQAVFLQKTAHPDVRFRCHLPEGPLFAACDSQQVARALTNLLLNAVESIEGRIEEGKDTSAGEVTVSLLDRDKGRTIVVEDNGRGLPVKERHRLVEPYMTTRERGTGLGLAIVHKIMEDHGGELKLEDRPDAPGARVSLIFGISEEPGAARRETEAAV
jgi:two-component system nitrogen regulation sensor histidine kinase NtrY